MTIDEYLDAVRAVPSWDRTPAISDRDLDELIHAARHGQHCIVELYTLLERLEDGARHHDLTLLRVPRGATGCDMYQGLPPICRVMDDILSRYEDIITGSMKMKG